MKSRLKRVEAELMHACEEQVAATSDFEEDRGVGGANGAAKGAAKVEARVEASMEAKAVALTEALIEASVRSEECDPGGAGEGVDVKEAVRGEGAGQSGCGKQTRDGMAGDVSHISGSGEGRSSTHEKEKGKSGDGGVGARKRMPRASSRTCGVKVPCVRDLGRVIKVYHTVKPCIHLSHLVSCVVQQLPPQQQTRYSTTTASCSSYRLNQGFRQRFRT